MAELSPILEQSTGTPSSPSAGQSDTAAKDGLMKREISYESEHEGERDGEDTESVASGETITQARIVNVENNLPSSPTRMTVARPIHIPVPSTSDHSPSRRTSSGRGLPGYWNDTPPPTPGGLPPPPRPALTPSKIASDPKPNDQPGSAPRPAKDRDERAGEKGRRERRQSQYDAYAGGRDVINLDTDNDDDDGADGRSVMTTSTALTAGLAGIGAGERAARWDWDFGDREEELRTVKEESPLPSRRGTNVSRSLCTHNCSRPRPLIIRLEPVPFRPLLDPNATRTSLTKTIPPYTISQRSISCRTLTARPNPQQPLRQWSQPVGWRIANCSNLHRRVDRLVDRIVGRALSGRSRRARWIGRCLPCARLRVL